jgi:hypothetical protein
MENKKDIISFFDELGIYLSDRYTSAPFSLEELSEAFKGNKVLGINNLSFYEREGAIFSHKTVNGIAIRQGVYGEDVKGIAKITPGIVYCGKLAEAILSMGKNYGLTFAHNNVLRWDDNSALLKIEGRLDLGRGDSREQPGIGNQGTSWYVKNDIQLYKDLCYSVHSNEESNRQIFEKIEKFLK